MSKAFGMAVKAVIRRPDGCCLLIRRSARNRNFVGKWEWPGGKVDPGETFDAAVHREVAEETGLQIEITGLAGATSFEMPNVTVVLLCMEVQLKGGSLRLSEEHDDSAWVSPADLAQYDLTEHIRPFMLEYAAKEGRKP